MTRIGAPFSYYGGKYNLAPRIVALMPQHHTYVEPFGGAASVLLAKAPSPVEVYNDIDSGLVHFFRILRDPELGPELRRRAELVPYSREERAYCRATWEEQDDPVEKALRWWAMAAMSFAGHIEGTGWGYVVSASSRGRSMTVSQMAGYKHALKSVAERLLCVQIEHGDWECVVSAYDTPETLFYCDPPYVLGARIGEDRYSCEMDDAGHEQLLNALMGVEGMVMLSAYPDLLYDRLTGAGWEKIEWGGRFCFAHAKTRLTGALGAGVTDGDPQYRRTEVLWRNPACLVRTPRQLSFGDGLAAERAGEDIGE